MLPNNVGLSAAVGDDKSDVTIRRQLVKCLETQCRLLDPAVIVVG